MMLAFHLIRTRGKAQVAAPFGWVRSIGTSLALILLAGLGATPAYADLKLFNTTASRVGVAIDYGRGGEWAGALYMCTDDKSFTVRDTKECVKRGYKRTGFFEVDTGEERDWTVRLTDPEGEAKSQ